MSEQWKFLLPTDQELGRVLQRFPTLTDMGFHTLGKQQRENDWRASNGLPPIQHRLPLAITRIDQRKQIALVRTYVRAIQLRVGDPPGMRCALSYVLQRAVAHAAGERISNGAVIAAAVLEECTVEAGYLGSAHALIWMSISSEVQRQLIGVHVGSVRLH